MSTTTWNSDLLSNGSIFSTTSLATANDTEFGLAAYFFSRDARYLALAWRLFRWALIVALVFFALLIVERVFVTVA